MRVDAVTEDQAVEATFAWLPKGGRYICASNTHSAVESYYRPEVRQAHNDADLVTPDGRPLMWALKALGERGAHQVCGPDLTARLMREAAERAVPIGLYGGRDDATLQSFARALTSLHPTLEIAYQHSPPFRALSPEEEQEICRAINASGAQILFVGIGMPKQELWMHRNARNLRCVSLGVGAAFDFIAGTKKRAPVWMRKAGLEWFFRLACEPKRLASRYGFVVPRFIGLFTRQLLIRGRGQ